MIPFLKESTKQLSASSENLGAVRQETRVSDLVATKMTFLSSSPNTNDFYHLPKVSLMMDYVVVLTEKYDLLHMQLLDARQLIDKNHIVIERDKVDKVTVDSVDLLRPWEIDPPFPRVRQSVALFLLSALLLLQPQRIEGSAWSSR